MSSIVRVAVAMIDAVDGTYDIDDLYSTTGGHHYHTGLLANIPNNISWSQGDEGHVYIVITTPSATAGTITIKLTGNTQGWDSTLQPNGVKNPFLFPKGVGNVQFTLLSTVDGAVSLTYF